MASDGLDPRYFSDAPWADRVRDWVEDADSPFAAANEQVVRQVVASEDSGARVVVNVGPTALLQLLAGARYLNLYERPLVGGERQQPSATRRWVDETIGLTGADAYFAALAVGGAGVRFYGEYCLVLDVAAIDAQPSLFDRDSYELLAPPFAGRADLPELVGRLSASWDERHDVLVLKVLPGLTSTHRSVTSGTVADAVLSDQDFVEVHLTPDRTQHPTGCFTLDDVLEVRLSPVDVTLVAWLRSRREDGLPLSDEEALYLRQREDVQDRWSQDGPPRRVVGTGAGGYGWT